MIRVIRQDRVGVIGARASDDDDLVRVKTLIGRLQIGRRRVREKVGAGSRSEIERSRADGLAGGVTATSERGSLVRSVQNPLQKVGGLAEPAGDQDRDHAAETALS